MAFDTIVTPYAKKENILGGSVTYFAISAAHFSEVGIVSVVGDDFGDDNVDLLKGRYIDVTGLVVRPGKTFQWEGRYEKDMIHRTTLRTELNVFGDFNPVLPESYKDAGYALIGNGVPSVQLAVFKQLRSPQLALLDTMDYWIKNHFSELEEVISTIGTLCVDKGEILLLSGEITTRRAVRMIFKRYGLKLLIVKLAEYGAMLFTKDFEFFCPAYMNEKVVDPTGCGDSFAGGFLGYLSRNGMNERSLKTALINACAMGSFTCEEFGIARLIGLTSEDIEGRVREIAKTIAV